MSGFVPYPPPRPYRPLTENVASLRVRQHPDFAVVTPENKEKMRRPVDPPPIVQLFVTPQHDPTKEFLVNPFLFMTATLVEEEEQVNGTFKPVQGTQIIGQNVSSLHRLKDVDNKDGGFFVFGDISCRKMGNYRMQFNLFDFDKNNSQVAFVSSIISNVFRVVSQKDFKGLSESTHLSRTFSDQGVRLRLRKEPRTITGTKRGYPEPAQEVAPNIQSHMMGGPVHDGRSLAYAYGYDTPQQKRARSGSEQTPFGSASSQQSGVGMSQYPFPSTASTWPSQPQHGLQSEHSSFGSLAPHLQPQMGPNSNYQRYIQPDAYSADSGATGSHFQQYNNSRTYSATSRYNSNYMQPTNQSYDSRTSRDAFQSMPSLHNPASNPMPGSSMVANQGQSQDGLMSQSAGQPSGMRPGLLSSQHSQHHEDSEHDSSHYGLQTLPLHSPNPAYQTDAHSDSVFGQSTQPEMKYAQNNYQTSNSMYSNSPAGGSLSDTSLPLGNGMLNRSFAPNQQPMYHDGNGPGMDGFKQEPHPYPTPNQTSPMG